jgi:hypothetical protein
VAKVFYETLALAAFALLGLWWVVVAERRREWAALPYRRRQAYSVSLYFTLTGIMSLVSLISESHPALWRLAFGISAGLGAVDAADVGIHLKPLETEAIVVSALFFLGINYGWLLFMEPAHVPGEGEE